jgi:ribosomal protein S18 acetylase RimI-like enzyme
MKNVIESLQEKDLKQVSQSLANAFMKDPLQNYVFPDEDERRKKSPAHFEPILRYGLLFGEVYTTTGKEGAIVWLKPNQTEVTPEKILASGLDQLHESIGEEAAGRFFSALEYIDPFHKEDVPEAHWYLMVVGVDPAYQSKGIGQALILPVLEKARDSKTPVYLETACPSNVSFYQKLGFKVIREVTEPVSQLPMWTFKQNF